MTDSSPRNILFVCTGNTCRSPMAERIMAHLCRELPGWTFGSAGLFAATGAPASVQAAKVLREMSLDLTSHLSRPLTPELIRSAEWVIGMTRSHADLAAGMVPAARHRIRTLSSFRGHQPGADIMDPYGGGLDTYRIVRDEILACLQDLLLTLISPTSPQPSIPPTL
jgi:protein-tyrosine-phosphatase